MGTNFFVAAPPARSSSPINLPHTIYVGTAYSTAGYTIEDSSGSQVNQGIATSSSPGTYFFDGSIGALTAPVLSSAFGDRNNGLHIMAVGNESLFVLYTLGDEEFFGSFLSYPCVDFQESSLYEYYAVSVEKAMQAGGDSQVLLVGCEDNTTISITPTQTVSLPLDAQTESSLVEIPIGSTSHTITLHQTQTLIILNQMDLTGTKVTSDKPLAVISGHTCGNVPAEFRFCEQLAVQIPPTLTWGTEFLLAPFAIRSSGQVYKMVASKNDTLISIIKNDTESEISSEVHLAVAGGEHTLITTSGTFYYVSSDKPIFMAQFATGGIVDSGGDGIGDPVMLIVSPTHMYISSTTFITLGPQFTQHAISVTVKEDAGFDPNDILFDGQPLNCTWTPILNLGGSVVGWGGTCTNVGGNSQHCVTHNKGGSLSVLSYGFGTETGYGYLAGMKLQRLVPNEPITS